MFTKAGHISATLTEIRDVTKAGLAGHISATLIELKDINQSRAHLSNADTDKGCLQKQGTSPQH